VGLYRFVGDELALGYWESPCAYQAMGDVEHGYNGVHGRGRVVLDRSFDGGENWSERDRVVLGDETLPIEAKRRFLFDETVPREKLDMLAQGGILRSGRTFAGDPIGFEQAAKADDATRYEKGEPSLVCYVQRSVDKGYTWEKRPAVIPCPRTDGSFLHRVNRPFTRLADGTILGAFTIQRVKIFSEALIYASQDDGLTWQYVSQIAAGRKEEGYPAYPTVVLLPDGRLLCVMLMSGLGRFLAPCMAESCDGGISWSQLRPIVRLGRSPWREHEAASRTTPYQTYWRSPFALVLRDGRVLVLYARRWPPFGIGGLLSGDSGQTWSDEFVLRADGTSIDIGYPVAAELEDGTIFTAYYYTSEPEKAYHEQIRYIAATHFRI
jgi:hypothetical protein